MVLRVAQLQAMSVQTTGLAFDGGDNAKTLQPLATETGYGPTANLRDLKGRAEAVLPTERRRAYAEEREPVNGSASLDGSACAKAQKMVHRMHAVPNGTRGDRYHGQTALRKTKTAAKATALTLLSHTKVSSSRGFSISQGAAIVKCLTPPRRLR